MKKEVALWLEQALCDFKAAQDNLKSKNYYLVARLCHQALEKTMKALFLHRHEHNPAYLLSRYPDVAGAVPAKLYDRRRVVEMIANTQQVLTWMNKRLKA